MPIATRSAPAPSRRVADGRTVTFGVLTVLVAAFPWDDALGFPTETVSVPKLLGLLLVGTYLLTMAGRAPLVRPPTLVPVIVLLGLVAASLVAAGEIGTTAPQALRYALFAGLFVLVAQVVDTGERIVVLAGVLVASAAAASVVGLARFVAGSADRASGPIGDANDFAYLLATVLPLGLLLLVREGGSRPSGLVRLAWLGATVVIGAAVLGTLSRGAIAGLVVAAVWAAVRGRVGLRSVAAAAAVLVVVAGAALVFQRPFVEDRLHAKGLVAGDNIESRQALWGGALDMAADHPVLGVGPGMYPVRADEYVVDDPLRIEQPVAHNAYLEVLAENGVPALLALVAFVVGTWVVLRRTHRLAAAAGDRGSEQIVTALQAAHIVAVVGAGFLSVQITPPLWFIGALAVALRATVAEAAPAPPSS